MKNLKYYVYKVQNYGDLELNKLISTEDVQKKDRNVTYLKLKSKDLTALHKQLLNQFASHYVSREKIDKWIMDVLFEGNQSILYDLELHKSNEEMLTEVKEKLTNTIEYNISQMKREMEVLKPIEEKVHSILNNDGVDGLSKHNESCEVYQDFINYASTEKYRNTHIKKKTDILSDKTFVGKRLDYLSDRITKEYDDSESPFYYEYTILPANFLDSKIMGDRKNKQVVSLNDGAQDDSEEVPSYVLKGYEVHLDSIDKLKSKEDWVYKKSEEEKRKERDELVKEKIEEYPTLKSMYQDYEQMGIKYGFDKRTYDKRKRQEIKEYWLKEFEKEDHKYSPKKRYYELRKAYNDLGYDISKILEFLRDPVKKKGFHASLKGVDFEPEKVKEIDLENPEHVAGFLHIDYKRDENRHNAEYTPILQVLENAYKDKVDSDLKEILEELKKAITYTDLTDLQRDIVYLIWNKVDDFTIYDGGIARNPWKQLTEYINEKYKRKSSVATYKKMVQNAIAEKVATTHTYLLDGVSFKSCTKCEVNKLAVKESFGVDKRNNDGLKSICKNCEAESRKQLKKNA